MAKFTITVDNQPIIAEQTGKDNFVVRFVEKPLQLYVKQDNEGANHWFDASTDNETPQTKEAGKAIEAYKADNGA